MVFTGARRIPRKQLVDPCCPAAGSVILPQNCRVKRNDGCAPGVRRPARLNCPASGGLPLSPRAIRRVTPEYGNGQPTLTRSRWGKSQATPSEWQSSILTSGRRFVSGRSARNTYKSEVHRQDLWVIGGAKGIYRQESVAARYVTTRGSPLSVSPFSWTSPCAKALPRSAGRLRRARSWFSKTILEQEINFPIP